MISLNDLTPNPTPPVVDRGFVALDDPRFREVHCSTIQVASGVEYVTWFGGTKEGHPDIKIWWVHNANHPVVGSPVGSTLAA
jgi:predicted neuraminidase